MKQIFPERERKGFLRGRFLQSSLLVQRRSPSPAEKKEQPAINFSNFPGQELTASASYLTVTLTHHKRYIAKNDGLKIKMLTELLGRPESVLFVSYMALDKLCCPKLRKTCGFLRFV